MSLYEDWKLGNISENEYKEYLNDYTDKISNISKNIEYLKCSIKKTKEKTLKKDSNILIKNFTNAKELTYEMVECLIDSIEIYADNKIKINFKYDDEYKNTLDKISKEVSYE